MSSNGISFVWKLSIISLSIIHSFNTRIPVAAFHCHATWATFYKQL